jgi:hypothetical protein
MVIECLLFVFCCRAQTWIDSYSSRVQFDFLKKVTDYVSYAASLSTETPAIEVLNDLVAVVEGRQKINPHRGSIGLAHRRVVRR